MTTPALHEHLPDAELWHLVRQGNETAYETVVRRHQALVCAVAYNACGNLTLSEDVAQETFWAAWRERTALAEPGRLRAWLCGIARRQVALFYRKQERHLRVRQAADALRASNGEGAGWLISREPPPAKLLESAELATLVRAALSELSDDYGQLLATRYLEDVSVERIADSEQSSPTAIRSKLARARAAFREAFVLVAGGESSHEHRE